MRGGGGDGWERQAEERGGGRGIPPSSSSLPLLPSPPPAASLCPQLRGPARAHLGLRLLLRVAGLKAYGEERLLGSRLALSALGRAAAAAAFARGGLRRAARRCRPVHASTAPRRGAPRAAAPAAAVPRRRAGSPPCPASRKPVGKVFLGVSPSGCQPSSSSSFFGSSPAPRLVGARGRGAGEPKEHPPGSPRPPFRRTREKTGG